MTQSSESMKIELTREQKLKLSKVNAETAIRNIDLALLAANENTMLTVIEYAIGQFREAARLLEEGTFTQKT